MEKLDLENIFIEANVKSGEKFYTTLYGVVEYESISHFLGTTLLNFRTIDGKIIPFNCSGYYYLFGTIKHGHRIFPSIDEHDWIKWLEERKNGNKCEEKLFQTENKIVYLQIPLKVIKNELTGEEYKKYLFNYVTDRNIEIDCNETMPNYWFVTSTLKNILINHLLSDLRFLVPEKTEYHITEFKLKK